MILAKSRKSVLGLSRREKITILTIFSLIGITTVAGFVLSVIAGSISTLLAGLGIVTYFFGLRHGVDADHIAAIDNTTRKLLQDGKRPLTVGMWFSLGHSTIVIALIVALTIATRTVVGSIPALRDAGAVLGTTVSGIFLVLIGLINAAIAFSIYHIFQDVKRSKLYQAELEILLESRGFLNRYFRPLFKIIRKSWQIYPIGVLFGLGFDTASEVALIAISVGIGVSSNVPIWMILVLPFMFTCGMVLVDTADGVVMRVAYGWAFLSPIRKIYYNLTVTIISVLVALVIGGVELIQVLSGELNLSGPLWDWLSRLDFEAVGIGIIGVFAISWLVSIAYWKYKRFDEVYSTEGIRKAG